MNPWRCRTLLVMSLALTPAAAAEPTAPAPIEAAVARLGAADFAEREAAQAELLGRGAEPGALAALGRAAATSDDAEVRQRAAGLLDALTRHAEGARLLKPRAVALDFRAVPLDAAVAELRKLTGANLRLDPARVADPSRPVSVTAAAAPAWEAVERFRRAAGLVELFREDAPPAAAADAGTPSVRRSYYGGPTGPAATANLVPVLWADAGAADATPLSADRGGPVRVTALPGRFAANRVIRGSGQVVIHLDVAVPADLNWEQTHEVRLSRAEDDTARPLTAAHALPAPAPAEYNEMLFLGNRGFLNNNFITPGVVPDRGNPRLVPVTLKTDDRLARRLRVLEGVVVGTVSLANQTVITVDDLAKSVGVGFEGPGETKLTVQSYDSQVLDKVSLKVVVEVPNPYTAQVRLGRRRAVSFWEEGGLGHSGLKDFRFTDAAGKPLTPQVLGISTADDGTRQSITLDIQFPPLPGVTAPKRLTVLGSRPVTLAVPFKLRDVPLP